MGGSVRARHDFPVGDGAHRVGPVPAREPSSWRRSGSDLRAISRDSHRVVLASRRRIRRSRAGAARRSRCGPRRLRGAKITCSSGSVKPSHSMTARLTDSQTGLRDPASRAPAPNRAVGARVGWLARGPAHSGRAVRHLQAGGVAVAASAAASAKAGGSTRHSSSAVSASEVIAKPAARRRARASSRLPCTTDVPVAAATCRRGIEHDGRRGARRRRGRPSSDGGRLEAEHRIRPGHRHSVHPREIAAPRAAAPARPARRRRRHGGRERVGDPGDVSATQQRFVSAEVAEWESRSADVGIADTMSRAARSGVAPSDARLADVRGTAQAGAEWLPTRRRPRRVATALVDRPVSPRPAFCARTGASRPARRSAAAGGPESRRAIRVSPRCPGLAGATDWRRARSGRAGVSRRGRGRRRGGRRAPGRTGLATAPPRADSRRTRRCRSRCGR